MSRPYPPASQGFSTVELLISLFIAAAFIGTGFQLFSVVMDDSDETRLRAAAGSVADATIQENINSVNSPCNPTPASETIAIPTTKLPAAEAEVTFSCPYGNSSKTTRINVTVSYGTPQKTVQGSLDVTK